MLLRLYKIRTYAQLDTWSRGTKQSQTKPISPDLPLPSQQKTALSSLFTRSYATTPQSQKQTQTNPISTPADLRTHPESTESRKPQNGCSKPKPDITYQYCTWHKLAVWKNKMPEKAKIYTVSQVNLLIKQVLADNLPPGLTVTGQITDFKLHHSGHCYFALKDQDSQLPCVMWKSSFRKLKFEPENGLAVLANGFIDVYPPHGRYQLYVESMQPAGVGALQLAFEQMVTRLTAEGLFDEKHKKPLPPYPRRIAVLTSESGAAVHDIIDSIYNRWPCAALFLYPIPVQGQAAAGQIAAALTDINRRNNQLKLDVLILGRGGGSLEDLWAFNEEVVARAVFDSKIPVISAVGHEVDVTIADLVADARASTPTKAGVVAVPDMQEVAQTLTQIELRLNSQAKSQIRLAAQNLHTILASAAFRNPLLPVLNCQMQIDNLDAALADALKQRFNLAREKLAAAYEKIVRIEPHRLLGKWTVHFSKLENQAASAVKAALNTCRMQLTAQANRLQALNPKSVLQRGYSITVRKKTGLLIRKPADVQIDDFITTELAGENFIESKVTKK